MSTLITPAKEDLSADISLREALKSDIFTKCSQLDCNLCQLAAFWYGVHTDREVAVQIATPSPAPPSSPRQIPDLSLEATRAALTDAALEAFIRLSDIWRLTSRQAAALLGESERTWFRIKARQWNGILSQDALTRISATVGVYKGLHLLFSEPLANEWVRRSNTESLFGGTSPVDYMIKGGIPAMLETRGYVDALRGGL